MRVKHQNNEISQVSHFTEYCHVIIAPVFFCDRIKHSRTINYRHVFQDRAFHLFHKEMRHKSLPEFFKTTKGESIIIHQG